MNNISKNPLDYVTNEELKELGLSDSEIAQAYQPSSGGVFHARGEEGKGKTLWVAHYVRNLIDAGIFTPYDAVGNITLKGKYGVGYTTLKGDDLRQFLWDLTHKPYRDKIVIIDEIDSEFPARFFSDREQTEIALRLWHTSKLHNYIFMTSHAGNSTDVITHLASHYWIYPEEPNFETNEMDFTFANVLTLEVSEGTATDIIKTMLIYNRQELTENTEEDSNKIRYSKQQKKRKRKEKEIETTDDIDLDFELEIEKGLLF